MVPAADFIELFKKDLRDMEFFDFMAFSLSTICVYHQHIQVFHIFICTGEL